MNILLAAKKEGGFNAYGFIIGTAIILCCIGAYFVAKKRKTYYNDLVFDIALAAVPLAAIGARVYYVVFWNMEHPKPSAQHIDLFWEAFAVWNGGLAIYGAVLGAMLGIIILYFVRRKKPDSVSIVQMYDLGAPFLMIGQAIGRWGNFFNKEAFGNYIGGKGSSFFPIGVWIEKSNSGAYMGEGYYQATFFYESFFNLIGAAIMIYLLIGRRKSFDGANFVFYCCWYGLVRTFVESLRTDSLYWGNLKASIVLSVIFIILGLGYLCYYLYRARKAGLKPMILVPEHRLNPKIYYGVNPLLLEAIPTVDAASDDNADANDGESEESEDKASE